MPFASKDNLRIGIHGALLFLSVNSWEKDNGEEILIEKENKSYEKAERIVVVTVDLGICALFHFCNALPSQRNENPGNLGNVSSELTKNSISTFSPHFLPLFIVPTNIATG